MSIATIVVAPEMSAQVEPSALGFPTPSPMKIVAGGPAAVSVISTSVPDTDTVNR